MFYENKLWVSTVVWIHVELNIWRFFSQNFPCLCSFTWRAAVPADRWNPKANIIYTHSYDPLHCLQLQGVFVAVQHLLQVVVSEGGNHWKSAQSFFFSFAFFYSAGHETTNRGLKQETQTCVMISIRHSKFIKVCKCDPEIILFEVWKPACKMWKTFETAARKSGVIGKWHNP